jgi:hypothetical protein
MAATKVGDRLSVNKGATKTFNKRTYNLKSLKEMTALEQYRLKLPNSFAPLQNLNNSTDIIRSWENITERKISAKTRLGYNKELSKFIDRTMQNKLQSLQDPGQINVDNYNDVSRET